jgi:Family of unknown function (DUF5985)
MAEGVYVLCAVTSIICAALLYRGYAATRTRLLFWSSLCFLALALNNALLIVDLYVLPDVNLAAWRGAVALVGLMVLLYGLVQESR